MRTGGEDRVLSRPHDLGSAHAAPPARYAAAVLVVVLGLASAGTAPAAVAAEAVRTDTAAVAAGSSLTVSATGFPASRAVELGAGPPQSDYEVLDTARTDEAGTVIFHARISPEAPAGMLVVFVVATEDLSISAASPPVEILAAPGS